MKNPDLIAGLLCLLALLVAGGAAAAGHQILSTDLMAVLSAFVMAAFARWRLGLRKPAEAPEGAPTDAVPEEILPAETEEQRETD